MSDYSMWEPLPSRAVARNCLTLDPPRTSSDGVGSGVSRPAFGELNVQCEAATALAKAAQSSANCLQTIRFRRDLKETSLAVLSGLAEAQAAVELHPRHRAHARQVHAGRLIAVRG